MSHLRSLVLIVFFAAFGLAACASDDARSLTQEPSYEAGYGDGCSTGSEEGKSFSTKRVRDDYLFKNDRAYRAGWRQGYLECKSRLPARNNGGRILGDQTPE